MFICQWSVPHIIRVIFLSLRMCGINTDLDLTYTLMTDDVSVKLQEACTGMMPAGEVIVSPPGVVLNTNYKNVAQTIIDLEVKKDDVWLICFPKAGMSWLQEMVWLLKNNVDIERAKKDKLEFRAPFLDYKALCAAGNPEPDPIDDIKKMTSGRIIKTHMPVKLLPQQIWSKKPKVIYLTRNPKDTAVSYYHHFKIWNNYVGSKELFLQAFIEDKVVLAPYWKHVLTYYKLRNKKNFLFITYEDMHKDLVAVMKKVAAFLEVPYPQDQEAALLAHLDFKTMTDNVAVNLSDDIKQMKHMEGKTDNRHFRTGKVGTWQEEFTPEFNKKFNDWIEKNTKGTGYERVPETLQ